MPDYLDPSYFAELASVNPDSITSKTNCSYNSEDKTYYVKIWGIDYVIDPAISTISRVDGKDKNVHEYFELFIIYYLIHATNTESKEEWISEKDLQGGPTFFRGPHLLPTQLICEATGNDLQKFKDRCTILGGKPLDMADCAFHFEITPEIPVAVLYWQADDDFPAEAKLLFDRSMENLLPLDIVFALAYHICYMFKV